MAQNIWHKTFWKDAGERALSTVAQTWAALILAAVGGELTGVADFAGIPWLGILATGLLAGALSVLKAVGAGKANGTAAVGKAKSDTVKPQGTEQGM